jgi:zona occludens toxin (predicted ATPase)
MSGRFPVSLRTLILGSLALTMVLSLIYSNSVQYGHADVPVAATAAEIQSRATRYIDIVPRWLVPILQYAPVRVARRHPRDQ